MSQNCPKIEKRKSCFQYLCLAVAWCLSCGFSAWLSSNHYILDRPDISCSNLNFMKSCQISCVNWNFFSRKLPNLIYDPYCSTCTFVWIQFWKKFLYIHFMLPIFGSYFKIYSNSFESKSFFRLSFFFLSYKIKYTGDPNIVYKGWEVF